MTMQLVRNVCRWQARPRKESTVVQRVTRTRLKGDLSQAERIAHRTIIFANYRSVPSTQRLVVIPKCAVVDA